MWRRVYFVLLIVRLYFALSPSYLHPDENFQGPEVIAGEVFSYPVRYTWEFQVDTPIRSVFPLWLVYGVPMLILRSLWQGLRKDTLPPAIVYWTLRVLMFTLSFVLEDWALLELINSSKQRRLAMILTASSYVTWTYQTHTFSNAIETLVVLWSLVLITRVVEDKERSGILTCMVLAFLLVLGGFNRITFPAYLLVPGIQLIPHFFRKPLSFLAILFFGILFSFMAIVFDTSFYHPNITTFLDVIRHPVITPLNNFLYNYSPENLAKHGLHPFYQHAIANLPQLLGPAFLLILFFWRRSFRLYSALSAIFVLSLFPHQEARFLIPAIPLILSSIRLPQKGSRAWAATWLLFNVIMGILMGTFHQGGVVPMQMHVTQTPDIAHVFWWKTYEPPIWLLDGKIDTMRTTDFMGSPFNTTVLPELLKAVPCGKSTSGVVLVAPASATALDSFVVPRGQLVTPATGAVPALCLTERFRYTRHVNLDDLDFAADGVWATLKRVWGRRGLVMWDVEKKC